MVTEIRYDYGIERLDMESTLALVNLTDHWRARARLRTKWASRTTLVGIPLPSDTRPAQTEDAFLLTRRLKPLTVDGLGLLVDELIAEYERNLSC